MATSLPTPACSEVKCPTWCTDHSGFSDGSDSWHKSRNVTVAGFEIFLSTGTHTGEPEIFIYNKPEDGGLPLPDAEALASTLHELVKAVSA